MLVVGLSIIRNEPRLGTIQWSLDLQTVYHH
jgi:hypothetical protein